MGLRHRCFKPLDIDLSELLKLVKKDLLGLFNTIRKVLNMEEIEDIGVHDTYFDLQNHEFLVEYPVTCKLGKVSVKVIHSQDHVAVFKKLYGYEKTKH